MSDKTNNDRLMQKTGMMIVYAWVLLAVGFFVLTAWDPSYLASSEDYVSILAIIGGPALLIVTKIIETWSQEKQAELGDYEAQASHERDMNAIIVKHNADMERNPHAIHSPAVEDSHGSIYTQVASLREEVEAMQKKIARKGKSE
tara:strand:+ start:619 stop:1053 length:435 start_codon:yes stop_codon:yes gene_type:complete